MLGDFQLSNLHASMQFCFYPGHGTLTSSIMSESAAAIAITTVLSILVIADIVGNSLVCAIIKRYRDMRYAETKKLFRH